MADYRLTQTGDQVQEILNNATMRSELAVEIERATGAEQTLQQNINAEASAREQADTTLQGNITTEEGRARAAEQQNATDIDAIEAKIPAAASAQNKLVDEQKMNSSIATETATYRGSYNLVTDLHLTISATESDIANALAATIATADNNDYCYIQIPVANDKPTVIASVERYKFNGTSWGFEYELNNSGFTSAQWDALNSGITSGLVAKLSALPTNAELTNLLAGKQDTIVDLDAIRSGAQAGAVSAPQATTYTKTEVDGLVGDEETRARTAEQANADDIDAIEAKIPAAASAQNKLATEGFVNSSVATNTATYRSSYNLVSDLSLTTAATQEQIATALSGEIATADNNDYCFVQIPVADATPTVIARVDRYKYDGTDWAFEYSLNNSGFTAAQWDALNSGITSGLVAKLSALPTNAELTNLLAGKQDTIVDLDAIRSGAQAGAVSAPQATTYTKTEVDGLVGDEETRARTAEQANADDIDAIEAKIPAAASAQNKLATEGFVNSSVATNTATYRSSYNLVSDLSLTTAATQEQIATALSGEIATADNNDYCFVQIPVADATPTVIARVDRYKYDGTDWAFEYSLNNSGFTAAQWDALNSGITSGLVTKLGDLPTNAELSALLLGKQNVIADLDAIRSGATAGATAYQKPATGIPQTDLTTELQLALASFITASAQNLAYYYLKSETYSASEVDQMIAAIKQFQYESVAVLPEASAQTVGKIYLVPSADPKTQNTKDEFITLTTVEEGTTIYSWECIGSTTIDLTNYYTKTQTDSAITSAINLALTDYSTTSQVGIIVSTAITTALANYYTKTQVDNIANTKTDKLTMTGEGASVEDDIMVIDENGNIKDGGKKISDLQLKVTDCAMLGGGFHTCSTAGGTAAKTVSIDHFLLLPNCRISVLFQNAFTASNPTLSINGGAAIAIRHFGRAMEIGKVHANTILTMVYDGTYWQVVGIEGITGSTPSGAVDLALPSGLLWCEHNVGAASPYDDGLYFSWGNVEGHTGTDGYDFGTANDGPYASTPGAALTGNIPTNGTYDAARHNMGAPWRMPTVGEFQELNSNCDSEWTDEDGVVGRRFTSRINGNSIFFPAAGYRYGTGLYYHGSNGDVWSASLNSQTNGYYLNFNSGGIDPTGTDDRFLGFSVRAVQ